MPLVPLIVKPQFRALQWTSTNSAEVMEATGGTVFNDYGTTVIVQFTNQPGGHLMQVNEGDWIVYSVPGYRVHDVVPDGFLGTCYPTVP